MKLGVLFVGTLYMHNKAFQRYILRTTEHDVGVINSVEFYSENDNSLFLYLESEIKKSKRLIIVTTKSSFSVIGKLLCTITRDNQILKDDMLIPSRADLFEHHSYLLRLESAHVNVIRVDLEADTFPQLLFDKDEHIGTIHAFEDDHSSLKAVLTPLAKTHNIVVEFIEIIPGWIQMQLRSSKYGDLYQFIVSAKKLLENTIIDASNIIAYIKERLLSQSKTLTFAESCTGGMIAAKFTAQSGISSVFEGSLISYSNELKSNWLAVTNESLEQYGAVSEQVVNEMSDGALNVSNADYAIAVSGIAGPDGGTDTKPVGTVYLSVRSKHSVKTYKLTLNGDRNYVQDQTVLYAIKYLLMHDKALFFSNSQ